jgi:hypothetical protein
MISITTHRNTLCSMLAASFHIVLGVCTLEALAVDNGGTALVVLLL